MSLIKKIFVIFIISSFSSVYAKSAPDSFADLAEQLMPSELPCHETLKNFGQILTINSTIYLSEFLNGRIE